MGLLWLQSKPELPPGKTKKKYRQNDESNSMNHSISHFFKDRKEKSGGKMLIHRRRRRKTNKIKPSKLYETPPGM